MSANHSQIANFIWGICNLLRGPYKRNEYRKVILPLTVLRRFDCLLADTKEEVLQAKKDLKGKPDSVVEHKLRSITGRPFYNLSPLRDEDGSAFRKLLDDPNQIAINLNSYINHFSPNVRNIMERFAFDVQITKMAEKDLLFEVVKAFCDPRIDLSADKVDNVQMGYVFEELIRIGAEQSNEEAGEHFTPREVIRLMVNLLLSPEKDLRKSHIVKTIYDPACGTGGMLSEAEKYIRQLNSEANPMLFGQDWNDEAWAVCKSDMLIKGDQADNIILGDTFGKDGFDRNSEGEKHRFDYMLANPPFGVEWKQQKKTIEDENKNLGDNSRFHAGLPRINDGSFLFLQHMISKMRDPKDGGSRIAIVFNGSPLFTGDAGSGESNIRQWIIENDWLEAIVAMPDQLFYNTGIFTYVWIVTNRKEEQRRGKVQLINAVHFAQKMRKSLGNKRNEITTDQIEAITKLYGEFQHDAKATVVNDGETEEVFVSKIFDNEDFGFRKVTVERPLRLSFQASPERIARLEEQTAFVNLAKSKKKKGSKAAEAEIAAGKKEQEGIMKALRSMDEGTLYKDRKLFLEELNAAFKSAGLKPPGASIKKSIFAALGEPDESAEICVDSKGKSEPDSDLRDYENVPLKEDVEAYFKREVLPHVPEAWIDESKTKVGYEIPLNRHFYQYKPPRPLVEIESDIAELETEIVSMLREVVG